jgi:hypothetical protein
MMTRNRSVVQHASTSRPEDAVEPRREARTRRTYRSPEVHVLGSLAAVRGGHFGPSYDAIRQLYYFRPQ